MTTIRLTAAQALVRYLMAQRNAGGDPLVPGMWAIFGHGNVAGMGEALNAAQQDFPTWRGHNEQAMAHAAIAFAKAKKRQQFMAVTSSIGPGATNMVTAAALAHANRLPVLLIPGDVFANRAPDPVLQQVEDFTDGTVSANDCFRPVSRYFDRIARPEQLLTALPRAMATMTDPANCGPVTLAFCQDTQAEAFDYPESFFEEKVWHQRRPQPDRAELGQAVAAIKAAKNPMIIAGGGVIYSGAEKELADFAHKHQIPVAETQAGKSAMVWDDELNFGSIGVTGASSANAMAAKADLVIAIGTRLQDFTTGSWSIFQKSDHRILSINVGAYDAGKRNALTLVADAKVALESLTAALGDHVAESPNEALRDDWLTAVNFVTTAPQGNELPSDSQIVGAVQRATSDDTVILGAAGSMPGELHKLWKTKQLNGYHMEYGFSCMGYEIAGGIGARMAHPDREVVVMVGDGSYLMMNSEVATSVMLGKKIIVIVTDNRGFGCINRLQVSTGQEPFNNLLDTALHEVPSEIDFAAHAAAMGAASEKVASIQELEEALVRARASDKTYVIAIDTDAGPTTDEGGSWWDVAIPEVSNKKEVAEARKNYEAGMKAQRSLN